VIRRLVAVGGAPASRLLGALLLGVCAAGFGVALMTSAGYLVSRAAEQPPILSLTIAIVAVRFFGLARPLARYLERLAMHDHALRALGRIRPRFYERIEPLAPTQLEGYRRGELLGRMVDDVDALQGLFARALGPPIVALAVAAGCVGERASGSLDPVLVATLALLSLASFDIVVPLPAAARELSRTLASGRRIFELTDRDPTIVDPANAVPPPPKHAPIELDRVTVRYAGEEAPALRRVSLRIEPGERVALLGPAGSGKTTVTKLLLRFLDPVAGRVTVAGRDVREFRQADVRRMFALAGQDAHVFHATIRANLALARPDAAEADLWHALDRARLGDWVASLPDGLDTLVGEEGTELSGGQRQRLTLARALLADTPVLLLDEPTAHVDAETAEELVRDVFDATRGTTVLLVTHRPEGLELADRVIRLT
jgi:ABC-type transport system involved in cytochrome bd biosynthesis fused ATPase/permease subunit